MSDKVINSDKDWYRASIVKMIFSIHNEDQLNSIYSFTKVFADDKEGRNESRSQRSK